ncbi:cell envelope biogenesis protein OmpA [Taibaiella sp. KBW10]|uniref:TonB-dependent receptor n=1 Tax=Taibaiella sp. KBW10 TaxID=2153357 RepID=UPI000F5A466B|nr:TonB-dependent receptor [Taibaiella sp. KBW10]RQO30915.1 cell envelope biogenesis protein OmpA [Taibaiella sp. KBW10]
MSNKFTLMLTGALMASSVIVSAQVTTSGIRGTVKDSKNEIMPGAIVTALHVPSGTKYSTVATNNGYFNIQGMRPGGPYTITVNSLGSSEKTYNNITLALGDDYVLNAKLTEESSTELGSVNVFAFKNPLLNSDRTGASTNINSSTISRMPTIKRSLTDFTRLTPQANGNSFAGRDNRYNNVQIDGANFNNGFGISPDALPGGSNQPISIDAIEEVQVNVAPFDVRQTGFTGAGINAITRSGTNDFSGSAYAFFRPKSFNGVKVGEDTLAKSTRTSGTTYGVRFGGPIIKNKLFFFANFEYENQLTQGNLWRANNGSNSGQANVSRVKDTDLNAVSNYLKSTYGYDPGRYEGYADNYVNNNIKSLIRLDWNINDKNTLTIKYNHMRGTSDQGTNASSGPNPRSTAARISSESIAFENANYSFLNKVQSVSAELNSKLSPKVSNQLLATYSRIQDTRSTPGNLFPFVDIWDGDLQAADSTGKRTGKNNYMSFGTELFSYNNDVINDNINLVDNITYQVGKHNITGGLNFQTMSYANSYMRMGTSYYRYNSVSEFLAGGKPTAYGVTYPYAGADQYARVNFGLAGLYAQDQVNLSDKFRLTYGLRADMPLFFNKPVGNPSIDTVKLLNNEGVQTTFTTAMWPKSKIMLSPRVGFNYDVLGDRSLQLRGGTGIFTGNIPFVWFTNMPTNAGVLQNTFEPVSGATLTKISHLEKDPMYWPKQLTTDFPASPKAAVPGSFSLIDPDFKMPQVWRTNLGADYKLGNTPFVLTADLIYTKDIVGVYQYNANRKAASGQLKNGGDTRDFFNNDVKYTNSTGTIIPVLANSSKGYSMAASLGISVNNYHGFSGSLFYNYSAAKDITGNPGSAAGSAWSNNYSINDPNERLLGMSQFAVPHRVVSSISYRIDYADHLATTFSLFYQGAHQGRYAYTYSGDINKDGVSLDLLYVPQNASEINFVPLTVGSKTYTAQEQRTAYEAFLSNDKILSQYKGKYVDRNAGLLPWLNRFDARILQDVYTRFGKNNRRNTVQISLDILNVGNLLSKDWGYYSQLNNGNLYAYTPLVVNSVSADGTPSFNMLTVKENGQTVFPKKAFMKSVNSTSTWGMQLGVRYTF